MLRCRTDLKDTGQSTMCYVYSNLAIVIRGDWRAQL